MKVAELATEFGKSNKEMIAFLKERGIQVKAYNSNLTEEDSRRIRGELAAMTKKAPGSDKEAEQKGKQKTGDKAESKTEAKTEAGTKSGQEPADLGPEAKKEQPKKKLKAVFRPQNAQQQSISRQTVLEKSPPHRGGSLNDQISTADTPETRNPAPQKEAGSEKSTTKGNIGTSW